MPPASPTLSARLEPRARAATRSPRPPLRWLRLTLALLAASILAGALVVVGAPLWLSICVGALAALRVAATGSLRALARGSR